MSTSMENQKDQARIEPSEPAIAGSWGTWRIIYTAGSAGIAVGGGIELEYHRNLLPLFIIEGDWTSPQIDDVAAAGYTTAFTTGKAKTRIEIIAPPRMHDLPPTPPRTFRIVIEEFPLLPSEEIVVTLGDTSSNGPGICTQHIAQQGMEFSFLVKYKDGEKWVQLPDSPKLDIVGGPPVRLRADTPTIVQPGEDFSFSVQPQDAFGHQATGYDSPLTITTSDAESHFSKETGPESYSMCLNTPGIQRITVLGNELAAKSNPIFVKDENPELNLYWGDIHGHSDRSDGLRSPDDYFHYARDVAQLDFSVLSDHEPDFGRKRPDVLYDGTTLDEIWTESCRRANEYHNPGQFVTFNGYEWTSGKYGHKCIYYLEDNQPFFSCRNPLTDTPEKLYESLNGRQAMVITHHPAGGPAPANLSLIDPNWEPLVEIYSCHGCSDAPGIGRKLWRSVEGQGFSVQEALDKGYPFGIIAGSDTHTSDPGNPLIKHPLSPHPYRVGIMAVYAQELTRQSLWDAMWARRVYATTGEKILLQFEIDGHGMGEEIELDHFPQIKILVGGTAPLARVEMIHNGQVVLLLENQGLDLEFVWREENISEGYYYLRVTQDNDEMAWSSPIWIKKVMI